jgi:hypothetical protein
VSTCHFLVLDFLLGRGGGGPDGRGLDTDQSGLMVACNGLMMGFSHPRWGSVEICRHSV